MRFPVARPKKNPKKKMPNLINLSISIFLVFFAPGGAQLLQTVLRGVRKTAKHNSQHNFQVKVSKPEVAYMI